MKGQAGLGSERDGQGTVLMVANYPPDVGYAWWLMERFWVELAGLAHAQGYAAAIAYPEPGEVPRSIRDADIETIVERVPGRGLIGLWRTYRSLRARRVRMVYFTDRNFTNFAYVVLRLAGVRVLVNHDHTPGDRPPVGGLKGVLKSRWRRLRCASCDLQVVVSPLIRQRAIENACIPPVRVAVVQNGIEPFRCDEDRDYARRTLGLPQGAVVCMTVARANPYKRVDFVIEVARRCVMERGRRDIVFVYCGDGPDMGRLRALASEAGVGDQFVFTGRREDVRQLLCSADLALHPSMGEAFSLAIVEYMSAGLAVLVPDIPTVCQAIRHGETGLVYPDGDAKVVTDHICRLVERRDERTRLGRAAARSVEHDYSIAGMDRQFRSILGAEVARLRR